MRALQLSENPPVNLLIRAQHRRCPSLRGGLDNPPMASQVSFWEGPVSHQTRLDQSERYIETFSSSTSYQS